MSFHSSVLGRLLFIMYTTPLSFLISSLSLNHHLYAGDTITCMQMILNCAFPFIHPTLTQALLSFGCISADLFLDVCNSFNSELLQD